MQAPGFAGLQVGERELRTELCAAWLKATHHGCSKPAFATRNAKTFANAYWARLTAPNPRES